jgi:hypothetical protein
MLIRVLLATIGLLGGAADAGAQKEARQTATLRGRVIDDRGQPIAASRVVLGWFIGPIDELRLLQLPLGGFTDPDGRYEIGGVPAGDWYVQAEEPALLPGAAGRDMPDYPATYYPGVRDARLARPVHFDPGSIVNIDLVVSGIPVFELSLRLSPLDQITARPVELFLDATEAGLPRVLPARQVEPGGIARFRRLRAGRYFLWARAETPTNALVGWRSIEVKDRSLELDFPLAPGGRISGRVIGAEPAALSGARVVAALVDGDREIDPRAPDTVEIGADGSFAIDGLFADRRLRVIGLPEPYVVKAVRIAGREVSTVLSIRPGVFLEGIEIVVAR